MFVSVFNLELFTLGYIVREKEGIRTPFTVNENEIITKRAEVGRVGCELLSTQILGPDIAFHWSESAGIRCASTRKLEFLNNIYCSAFYICLRKYQPNATLIFRVVVIQLDSIDFLSALKFAPYLWLHHPC